MEASTKLSQAERQRIEFLIQRDGPAATRAWVERTLNMYKAGVNDPKSHASSSHYKPLFKASIQTFEKWLAENP